MLLFEAWMIVNLHRHVATNLFRSQIAHFTWPSSATALYIQMQKSVKTLNSWHITFQFYSTSLLMVHTTACSVALAGENNLLLEVTTCFH